MTNQGAAVGGYRNGIAERHTTEIDARNKEIAAKNEMLASLNVENSKLRDSLTNAEDILKEMASKPDARRTTLINTPAALGKPFVPDR